MSNSFDPYHVWLGIPPAEQPPNHYRLLALAMYEDVAEVIENAADRQMAHVRKAASGKHADHSQQILNEISTARRCLLDGSKKQEYDAQLRAREKPPAKEPAMQAAAPPANGRGTPGIEATTEWSPTRPPKRKAAKPVAPPVAETLQEEGDRWKGGRTSAAPAIDAEPQSPVRVSAPSSVAQRTRGKKQIPWVVFAVIAGLAVLPILVLLYALASVSREMPNAESDGETVAANDDGLPNTDDSNTPLPTPPSDVGSGLPTPGAGGRPNQDRPRIDRPVRPRPTIDPYDNRDPLDDTPSFGTRNEPPDLDEGLIAYWKFDGTGMQRPAVDRTSVGDPDSQPTRLPQQTTAHIGGAMENSTVTWNHASWLERTSGAFTFAIWFRPHSVGGTQIIAGKRDSQAPSREWHLARSGDRVFARFFDDDAKNTEVLLASPDGSLKLNRWALVVVRFDESGEVDGYRQSLWVGTEESEVLLRRTGRTTMTLPVTKARFSIGDDDSGVPLDGDVDEAAYWDRALTDAEVKLYFNGGAGRTVPF